MGAALTQGRSWLAKRREDLAAIDREFIDQSANRESKARRGARRVRALMYVLLVGIIAGLVGWINQSYVTQQWNWFTVQRPYMVAKFQKYVLPAETERALKPQQSFHECEKDCPEMIVVQRLRGPRRFLCRHSIGAALGEPQQGPGRIPDRQHRPASRTNA
jgi:uncharacterized membrane protein YcjF (UPF0283 family)